MNAIVMTYKGRKDLTKQCLQGLVRTLDRPAVLSLVDAGEGAEVVTDKELQEWLGVKQEGAIFDGNLRGYFLSRWPSYRITESWNIGITSIEDELKRLWVSPEQVTIWVLNNDVVFNRPGWLSSLETRLDVPGTGLVGSSAMSVFGHPFVTGGIWGFNLAVGKSVAENGKILDERLNYCCQDVDISIRVAKAGYVITHVPDVELSSQPMITHLVSQTMYTLEPESTVLEKRKAEFDILIQKHGRRE